MKGRVSFRMYPPPDAGPGALFAPGAAARMVGQEVTANLPKGPRPATVLAADVHESGEFIAVMIDIR